MAEVQRRRKPKFLRTEWNKKPRLRSSKNSRWRRAIGRHSKIRQKIKGNHRSPTIGYGMPREIRGLVKGMQPKLIQNLNDLDRIAKGEIAVVSSTLGTKKKLMLAEKALKMKVTFLNFKPQELLNKFKPAENKGKEGEKK